MKVELDGVINNLRFNVTKTFELSNLLKNKLTSHYNIKITIRSKISFYFLDIIQRTNR